MQTFQLSTQVCHGKGALEALGTLSGRRFFLVTDPFFEQNGMAQQAAKLCRGEVEIFSGVRPDPTLATVAEGIASMETFGADTLIALGGGSAIDCAKGMISAGKDRPFFVAIPTTSGTGSEVTSFAVLTHEGVKHPLVDPTLRPNMAILDPVLLKKLPPALIADGGMDVIAHCVETVVAKNASAFSKSLAVTAFHTAMKDLLPSFEGDQKVRGDIHLAATLAGVAFDHGGLGLCHSLSHALGGKFHIPHGRLNGILLPHVMSYNREVCSYNMLGENPIFAVSRLARRLRLPRTLADAGVKASFVLEAMDELCEVALTDPCTATNPRTPTALDCRGILRACL